MRLFALTALASLITTSFTQKIILSNDDGWAVAQFRAPNDALKAAGFNVGLIPWFQDAAKG